MPCCGLHEYREQVPWRYTLAGAVVFWGGFTVVFLVSIAFCWTRRGRLALAAQRQFLASLWAEATRDENSIPARWSCRLSGYAVPWSPALAKLFYRRPEVPLAAAALVATLCLAGAGWALWRILG